METGKNYCFNKNSLHISVCWKYSYKDNITKIWKSCADCSTKSDDHLSVENKGQYSHLFPFEKSKDKSC